VLFGALLLGGFGLWLQSGIEEDLGLWKRVVYDLAAQQKSYVPAEKFADTAFINQTRTFAGTQCLLAGGVLLMAGILLLLQQKSRHAIVTLGILGVVEMGVFARAMTAQFPLSATRNPGVKKLLAESPGDYRILNLVNNSNSAMRLGAYDLWGYEPAVLGRYAEFLKKSNGGNPDDGDVNVVFHDLEPDILMALLRVRFLLAFQGGQAQIGEVKKTFPHVFLVHEAQILRGRDTIYNALHTPEFDPAKTVILETNPTPAPRPGTQKGAARVTAQTTDTLTIEAETPTPAILVVTDAYSQGWKAVALPGSSQNAYTVQPADYILRGIPLQAGKHRLRLEYAPVEYRIGLGISVASSLIFLALLAQHGVRRKRRRATD
jgi:hypothetical protein